MIKAAGVVIPAHNEEDLLPSCLAAIRQAIRVLPQIPVHLVVVADACTDRTADHAQQGGAAVLEIQARRVGAARRAGMREVLSRTRHLDPGAVWLATTDADTLVPPGGSASTSATPPLAGTRSSAPSRSPTGASTRPGCHPYFTSSTAPARAPIRTSTGPTSGSARVPTSRRAASSCAAPPRTTPSSSRSASTGRRDPAHHRDQCADVGPAPRPRATWVGHLLSTLAVAVSPAPIFTVSR